MFPVQSVERNGDVIQSCVHLSRCVEWVPAAQWRPYSTSSNCTSMMFQTIRRVPAARRPRRRQTAPVSTLCRRVPQARASAQRAPRRRPVLTVAAAGSTSTTTSGSTSCCVRNAFCCVMPGQNASSTSAWRPGARRSAAGGTISAAGRVPSLATIATAQSTSIIIYSRVWRHCRSTNIPVSCSSCRQATLSPSETGTCSHGCVSSKGSRRTSSVRTRLTGTWRMRPGTGCTTRPASSDGSATKCPLCWRSRCPWSRSSRGSTSMRRRVVSSHLSSPTSSACTTTCEPSTRRWATTRTRGWPRTKTAWSRCWPRS